MKKIYALVLVSGLAVAPQSHAEGWLDSLKGLFGMTEEVEAVPNISDMTRSVSDAVGITESQATGGLASIFNYAKERSVAVGEDRDAFILDQQERARALTLAALPVAD